MSKKLVLALFALASALAITPAATADTYTFNYTGSVFSGSAGTVTLDGIFKTGAQTGPDPMAVMQSHRSRETIWTRETELVV